jgi:hypothetical protein
MAWQRCLQTNPDAPLHKPDRKHPTPQGTYLAACLFHARLHDSSPLGLPGVIPKPMDPGKALVRLDVEQAAIYQELAAGMAHQPDQR